MIEAAHECHVRYPQYFTAQGDTTLNLTAPEAGVPHDWGVVAFSPTAQRVTRLHSGHLTILHREVHLNRIHLWPTFTLAISIVAQQNFPFD